MRNLVCARVTHCTFTPTVTTVASLCLLGPGDVDRGLARLDVADAAAVCAVALLRVAALQWSCDGDTCVECEDALRRVVSELVTARAGPAVPSFVADHRAAASVAPTIVGASAVCTVPEPLWEHAQARLRQVPSTTVTLLAHAVARLACVEPSGDLCRQHIFKYVEQLLD
jgi:hypothetical protein